MGLGGQLVSTRFEERSRFRRSVMWVLLLSGAACSCARDGASRTLLLVSVEVSEDSSSVSIIEVDTVHSDERTISLAVIFVFIIYVRFIGIFCYLETPSDLSHGTAGMVALTKWAANDIGTMWALSLIHI